MKKLKVMTIVGTRPEIIRLCMCIKACDRHFNHILVHTGQNWDYNLSQIFFDELDLRMPDYWLNCAGGNPGETMGNILAKSYEVMVGERPDAVLILGDTNSALSAICAKRLKIPIFHMEAGNRCWDWNVPEMINRKIVDSISDINLPYTEHARRYLISEGIDGKQIFVTGSPMGEVLAAFAEKIDASNILSQLGIEKNNYMVLSSHREENIDIEANFISLMNAVNHAAQTYQMPIIYSMHPRSRQFIEARGFQFHSLVQSHPPFGFIDYVHLQKNSRCVLSDSGTLSEESAILGFASVQIRTSTERPEALDAGTVIIGGIGQEDIMQAIALALELKETSPPLAPPPDYRELNVSDKVVRIIQSYTHIVNKTVWMK